MGFTKEQREKGRATRKANLEKKALLADKVSRVVAVSDQSALLAEIEELKKQLAISNEKRSAAESQALIAAESQLGSGAEEVPTGRTRKIKALDSYEIKGYHDDGREILKPKFKTVEVPTFFYRINMPPCGGTDLKINGEAFYHGTTYEFDMDTLRSVKEIVFRTWDHDRQIHGSDENFYRKPQHNVLSARGS